MEPAEDTPTLNLIDLDKLQALLCILTAAGVQRATIGELEFDWRKPPAPESDSAPLVGFAAPDAEEDEDDFDGYRKAFRGRGLPTLRTRQPGVNGE